MKKTHTQVLQRRELILTESQLTIIRAIRDHISQFRLSPTYEEIAARAGKKKSTIRDSVKLLVKKGFLFRAPGTRFRNIVITEKGQIAAANGRRKP